MVVVVGGGGGTYVGLRENVLYACVSMAGGGRRGAGG